MPTHLVTREFFGLARSRLRDGGTLYVNLIAPPWPDRLATQTERTLRSAFAWCEMHAASDASGWHNRVFAGRRSGLDRDTTVYSDEGTRGEADG